MPRWDKLDPDIQIVLGYIAQPEHRHLLGWGGAGGQEVIVKIM